MKLDGCRRVAMAFLLALLSACRHAPPELVPSHVAEQVRVDVAPRDAFVPREPRLMPAESLIRSYTSIFGDLATPEVRAQYDAASRKARYFGWHNHLSSLGVPDYSRDQPRVGQSNTIMVAAFEQIGIELCDRAAVRELHPIKPKALSPDLQALVQVQAPPVFAFDQKAGPLTQSDFTPRFDVLHRTFLGYPVALAPKEREPEFFALYKKVEARRANAKKGYPPHVAAWSAVCQGLVRHPEFHQF